MKNFICGAVCLFMGTCVFSQNTEIVSNGGGDITNSNISLSQTIGELMVNDLNGASTALEQGFHNTFLKVGFVVSARIFLQGAYNESASIMDDDLRNLNYIPLSTPYYDGAIITNSAVLDITGDDAIVDWVYVEIRDRVLDELVVAEQSALLQRDGDIVGLDGESLLKFELLPGTYFMSVNHRNHLGVLTNKAEIFTAQEKLFDFTDGSTTIKGGNNKQWALNTGDFSLISGDPNEDGLVKASGLNNDSNYIVGSILNAPGNIFGSQSYSFSGYNNEDLNMDGVVKITGTNNDKLMISSNILNASGNIFGSLNFILSQSF